VDQPPLPDSEYTERSRADAVLLPPRLLQTPHDQIFCEARVCGKPVRFAATAGHGQATRSCARRRVARPAEGCRRTRCILRTSGPSGTDLQILPKAPDQFSPNGFLGAGGTLQTRLVGALERMAVALAAMGCPPEGRYRPAPAGRSARKWRARWCGRCRHAKQLPTTATVS